MKDLKKCKPINDKTKGFESCGEMVAARNRTFGLCQKCLAIWATTTKEGDKYLKKITLQAKKKVKEQKDREFKEKKLANTDYKPKLQDRVNEIARLLDIGLPCLALGYHPDRIHGGHIFSRKAEPTMRYNLHNIHRQSAQSNHSHNDDGLLREKLCLEYGDEYFDFLNSMRSMEALKYSNEEYRDFYKKANEIAKELKRRGRRYNREERIELRNVVNLELGIYPEKFCKYNGE